MADANSHPITLGELARRLSDIHQDLKEDITAIARELDNKLSREVLTLELSHHARELQVLQDRVEDMERQRDREAQRRHEDKRALLKSVVAPIVVSVLMSAGALVYSVGG